MTVVEEIKERLDIVEYINQYVPLKKAGRNFQGLVPFPCGKDAILYRLSGYTKLALFRRLRHGRRYL